MNCGLEIPSRVVQFERVIVPDRPNTSTAAVYPKQVQKESEEISVFVFV